MCVCIEKLCQTNCICRSCIPRRMVASHCENANAKAIAIFVLKCELMDVFDSVSGILINYVCT